MSRNKTLVKNTLVLSLGSVSTKLISFLMVPLYTFVFSPEMFGVIDIIFTMTMIMTPVVALNIHESLMRYSLDKDYNQNDVVKTSFGILIRGIMISLIILPILLLLPIVSEYAFLTFLLIITLTFYYTSQSYLKGVNKIVIYAWGSFLCTFLIAALNLLFLLIFRLEIKGYLLAFILAYFISALVMVFFGGISKKIFDGKYNKKLSLEMIKYSIVLVPNSLMWWIINSSNRIFIAFFIGPAANGIYAIANKIPTLLSNFTSTFQQSWQLSAISEKDSEDIDKYSNNTFYIYYKLVILITSGLLFGYRIVIEIFVNNRFHVAWLYTPLLLLAFAFLSFGSFLGTYYTVNKDSFGMFKSAIAGALSSIISALILIPLLGLQGASISTLIGYTTIFLFRALDTKKYHNWTVFSKEFLIGIFVISFQSLAFMIPNVSAFYLVNIVALIVCVFWAKEFIINLFLKMFSKAFIKKS